MMADDEDNNNNNNNPKSQHLAETTVNVPATCYLCLEHEGPNNNNDEPLLRACACRGSSGYGHLTCLIESAKSDATNMRWSTCPTCRQCYIGEVSMKMAKARQKEVGADKPLFHTPQRSAMIELAVAKQRNGENDEAATLSAEVLAIQRLLYGPTVMHQGETLANVTNLAAAITELGRLEEALALLEEAKAGAMAAPPEMVQGGGSDTLDMLDQNIAALYGRQGKFDKALPMAEAAVDKARRSSANSTTASSGGGGGRSSDNAERLILALHSLSQMQSSKGDHDKAVSIGQEAVQVSLQMLGQAHPLTRTVQNGLTGVHKWADRPELSARESQQHYFSCRPWATVMGIKSCTELNGQSVRVGEFLTQSGRFRVLVPSIQRDRTSTTEGKEEEKGKEEKKTQDEKVMDLKPENLILINGVQVCICGLKSVPQLNGQEGVIEYFSETKCRYSVKIEGREKPLGVKQGNVRPL